jgi:hypothetical protein
VNAVRGDIIRSLNKAAIIAVVVVGAAASGPAAARSIVDFARNAGHVDGYSAVASSSEERGESLVATNKEGRLPNDIIKKAPDARALGGRNASDYQLACDTGSIGGYASVPSDVGSEWTVVPGYSLTLSEGGPVSKDGTPGYRSCSKSTPEARRTAPGTYEVSFAIQGLCFQTGHAPVNVTVIDTRSLAATAIGGGCIEGHAQVDVVHIFDVNGVATDAAFDVELLEPNFVPVP